MALQEGILCLKKLFSEQGYVSSVKDTIITFLPREEQDMSNHLKYQTSPYLLQHAGNPVYWYPWGDEAFEKAHREDKPIFLSIGYSTCHWCHVMAHESFEDSRTAEILNQYFISIKVDREERPDIDSVYMHICQALTGSGGWPMSIFMTAEQKPFFAGTYFPPVSRYGTIGFPELLLAIAKQWKDSREELLDSAKRILAYISRQNRESSGEGIPNLPESAAEIFSQSFDERYGGFGTAPKFPTPHNLIFLILYSRVKNDTAAFRQAEITLDKMRRGGIFDHIGYGFSRYSTDNYYLVPHFEKMLYDNALLILAYSAAYKASENTVFLDTAEKTAEYILREMTGDSGEFYSAQDADSEGEEGKYYVWSKEEICQVLGAGKGARFCEYFGITESGNFEGRNIPNLLNGNEISNEFDEERKQLYHYRKSRAALHLDDKVLTSWNALMICAMSMLYRVTGNRCYLSAAERACRFIEQYLAEGNLLYVSCRKRERSVKGFLDEYAYYTMALLSLYEASSKSEYLTRAKQICDEAKKQFEDPHGGFFLCGTQNSTLITRPKETYDGALPSGNSVMAYCLVRLSQITQNTQQDHLFKPKGQTVQDDIPKGHPVMHVSAGRAGSVRQSIEEHYRKTAERQLAFMAAESEHYPAGYSMFLIAQLFYDDPPQKITVVLPKEESAKRIIPHLPLYADVTLCTEDETHILLNGKTTYYVCKNHMCLPPSNEI